MIDVAQVERARNTSILSVAESRLELCRVTAAEYTGACPVCGGTDRFHVHRDGWWFCRHCHPMRGDVIEFVRFADRLGFAEAVGRLADDAHFSTERRTTPQPKAATFVRWTDAERNEAAAFLIAAQRALSTCTVAIDYLHGRSIEERTWAAFGFGYADKPAGVGQAFQKPAIVMPWYRAGRLVAIRYRYLEPIQTVDKKGREEIHKLRSWRGSEFAGVLFGGQAMPPLAEDAQQRSLLIVEGEINAVSCWQAAHESGLDVLSIGSESAHLSNGAVRLAGRYGQVFVWADREEVVRRQLDAIPGAIGIKSPNGMDANDLLQAGQLGKFLEIRRTGDNMTEAQALELHKRAYTAQTVTLADGSIHRLCWMGRLGRALRMLAEAEAAGSPHLAAMRSAVRELEAQAKHAMDAADAARGASLALGWPMPADCDCEECTANRRARNGEE